MRRVDELGSNYGSGRRDDSLRARARGLKIRVYQRGDFFFAICGIHDYYCKNTVEEINQVECRNRQLCLISYVAGHCIIIVGGFLLEFPQSMSNVSFRITLFHYLVLAKRFWNRQQ